MLVDNFPNIGAAEVYGFIPLKADRSETRFEGRAALNDVYCYLVVFVVRFNGSTAVSTTTNVNISMPERLRDAMRRRMAELGFENVSEYVRHLIREDQKEAAEQRLDEMLLDADRHGAGEVADEAWWTRLRAELTEKALRAKVLKAKRA
jgi:antitoxin ParD1/3/4